MALAAGSIAFTGFNADGNDALAFVVLADIAAGEQISFTLGVWSGSAFGSNGITITWQATAPVAAGSVVLLSDLNQSTPTANVGSISGRVDFLGNAAAFEFDEVAIIHAYAGSINQTPTTFITAASGSPFGWTYTGSFDGLANTGLVEGQTAIHFGSSPFPSITAYIGPRVITGDVLLDAARINLGYDPVSFSPYWEAEGGGGTSTNGTSPDLPFDTASFHEPLLYVGPDIARASEGAGADSLSFGFYLEVPLSVDTVVTYQVTGAGTYAADAGDFDGGGFPTGTVTILAGETSAFVTFTPADDGTQELNETFDVAIVGTYPGLSVLNAPARGAILDNDGPAGQIIARDDVFSTTAGNAISFQTDELLVNDSHGSGAEVLFLSMDQPPANGTLTDLGGGLWGYTPNPGFSGADTFTYMVGDGIGGMFETATVTITVDPAPAHIVNYSTGSANNPAGTVNGVRIDVSNGGPSSVVENLQSSGSEIYRSVSDVISPVGTSVGYTLADNFNVTGTDYADQILTAEGDDTIHAGDGDAVFTNGGNDTVHLSHAGPFAAFLPVLDGGNGLNDTLTIRGDFNAAPTGFETIVFVAPSLLPGEDAYNRLSLGYGDPITSGITTINFSDPGSATEDVLSFGANSGPLTIDLSAITVQNTSAFVDSTNTIRQDGVEVFGAGENDTITGPVNTRLFAFGRDGNDTITGGDYHAAFFGDLLNGDGGSDTLRGNGGSDFINGEDSSIRSAGLDTDTAVYDGNFVGSRYVVRTDAVYVDLNPYQLVLQDTASPNAVDFLTGIERLQFDDGVRYLPTFTIGDGGAHDIRSITIAAGATAVATLAATDQEDGSSLSYSIVSNYYNPGLFIVSGNSLQLQSPQAAGTYGVFVRATDSDGLFDTQLVWVTVEASGNQPPDGADTAIGLLEDTERALSAADFGFSDADAGDTLAAVRIDTLPAAGSLIYRDAAGNVRAVTAGEVIDASDIAASRLHIVGGADGNGSPYASFTFSVQDSRGTFDLVPNTITVNVTPVNDGPVASFDAPADLFEAGAGQPGNAQSFTTLTLNDPEFDTALFDDAAFVAAGWMESNPGIFEKAGLFGTVTFSAFTLSGSPNETGYVYYTLDNENAALNALDSGDTRIESFALPMIDGLDAQSTATVNFTIRGTNDGPVASFDAPDDLLEAGAAGSGIAQSVTRLTPTDPEGDAASFDIEAMLTVGWGHLGAGVYRLDTFYGGATLDTATGTLAYDLDNAAVDVFPDGGPFASEVIDILLIDARGAQGSASVTFNINGANDGSVAVDDVAQAREDVTFTATALNGVLANDSDPENDPLAVTQFTVAGVAGTFLAGESATIAGIGTLTINGNGSYHFIPAADFNGAVPAATYTVSDGQGATNEGSLSLTVAPVNDAPVAIADVLTVDEDSGIVGIGPTLNDTDADGDVLTLKSITINGTTFTSPTEFELTDFGVFHFFDWDLGLLALTLRPDFNGVIPDFTYVVSDGQGGTAEGTISIAVNPLPDAPVAGEDFAWTDEDIPLTTGDVLGNDRDADAPLTAASIVSFSQGAHGTVTSNGDGTFNYTPEANFYGADSFTYTLDDGTGRTAVGTVNVTVAPVNDAPTVPHTGHGINEDTPATADAANGLLSGATSDPDGDTLEITQFRISGEAGTYLAGETATMAGVGTLTIGRDGSYSFMPLLDYSGPVPVAFFTVSDGHGGTTESSLTITINPVDDGSGSATIAGFAEAGETLTASLGAPIPDGGTATSLTYQWEIDSGAGFADIQGADAATYTPDAGDIGARVRVAITYTDGQGFTNTAVSAASAPVLAEGDDPVALPDANQALPVVESGVNNIQNQVTIGDSVLLNDSDADAGDVLRVAGVAAGETTAPLGTGVGNAVRGTYGVLRMQADGTWTYILDNTDADTQRLRFGQTVEEVFSYTAADTTGRTATSTLTVNIQGDDDAPLVGPIPVQQVNEDASFEIDVIDHASDPDGGGLALVGTPAASHGAVAISGGRLIYTPAANFSGADVIRFTVEDESGLAVTRTFQINVLPVNDVPVAVAPSPKGDEDTVIPVTLAATDPDAGDRIEMFHIVGKPSNGKLYFDAAGKLEVESDVDLPAALDGTLTLYFRPTTDYSGLAAFDFRAGDGESWSSPVTATITVNPVNDAPRADDNQKFSAREDVSFGGTLVATDPDGDLLTFALYTKGAGAIAVKNGSVKLQKDGSFTYTPKVEFSGTERFTYSVTDPSGLRVVRTAEIEVAPVNDAPVFQLRNGAVTVNEDTTGILRVNNLVYNVRAGPANEVTQTTTVSVVANSNPDLFEVQPLIDAAGSLVYRLAPNAFGQAIITIRAQDDGGTANGGVDIYDRTYIINVRNVNDLPQDAIRISITPPTPREVAGPMERDTLVATGTIGDMDGMPARETWAYQWQRLSGSTWLNIVGATAGALVLDESLVGSRIRVQVTYTDGGGTVERVFSPWTDPIVRYGIAGNAANDIMQGTEFDDVFLGSPGGDIINGLGGVDTVNYLDAPRQNILPSQIPVNWTTDGIYVALDFFGLGVGTGIGSHAGGDRLNSIENVIGSLHHDLLLGSSVANRLEGRDGNDFLQGLNGDDTLFGGPGDDRLEGGHGVDTLYGDAGRDVLVGGLLSDTLYGGADDDTIFVGSDLVGFPDPFLNTAYGGDGDDRIFGDIGPDILYGDAGNDRIDGGFGDDEIHGGDGNDTLIGGLGFDNIYGGKGRDTLWAAAEGLLGLPDHLVIGNVLDGGEDDDTIYGNVGRDTIVGGAGFDRMTGGLDLDTFVFRDGDIDSSRAVGDLILDFSRIEGDRIDLRAMDANLSIVGDQAFVFQTDMAVAKTTPGSLFVAGGKFVFGLTTDPQFIYLNLDFDQQWELGIEVHPGLVALPRLSDGDFLL